MKAMVKRCISDQWIRTVVALLGFGLLAIALRYFAGLGPAEAIYAATGGAVVWYTVETYRLRKEMVRQNELAIQPLILATVERREVDRDRDDWRVILRNIGRGPALFVRVDDFPFDPDDNGKLLLRIPAADCIESGNEAIRKVMEVARETAKEVNQSGETHRNFAVRLYPVHADKTYNITIRYEDVNRRQHWAKIQMGKDGIRLLDHGKETA